MSKMGQVIWQQLKQGLEISKTASKGYKIAMSIMFLLYAVYNLSVMQMVMNSIIVNHQIFVLRIIIEGILFSLICHLFVRSYLKLYIINTALSVKRGAAFVGYLILVSIIYAAATYGISEVEALSYKDIEQIQALKKSISEVLDKEGMAVLIVMNSSMTLFGWSIVYVFWQQQLARKSLKKQMHQAQIQQLTNQLSPHFLFNSFNSIRALIYEDQDKAADTVTLLSELFRTHLQAHLKPKSSLSDEWQVSQQYLAIEQIRLEERLTVSVEIDPELTMQKLPTLTLLTLIENAVKHGISPSASNGFINIVAKPINDKRWSLTITNSVNSVNSDGNLSGDVQGTGTGLVNIAKRLTLMFGVLQQFSHQLVDHQFTVKMELPRA